MKARRTVSEIRERQGDYLMEVWETNKAHVLGLCRWRVAVWVKEVEWWYTLEYCRRPQTRDVAEREARERLARAVRDQEYPD